MNKKTKMLNIIQDEVDYWIKAIKQSVDLSKHNQWVLKCIPDYIKYIDSALAKAEKLGVDGLLDLQSIHNEITKYTKIYDKAIKEND